MSAPPITFHEAQRESSQRQFHEVQSIQGTHHTTPLATLLGRRKQSKGTVGAQVSLENKSQILFDSGTEEAKRRPRTPGPQSQS